MGKLKRMNKHLVDNTRRFEKECLGSEGGTNIHGQKNLGWTTEIKIKPVKIDDEE